MPERITKIEPVDGFVPDTARPWGTYDGYAVHTTEQVIHLLIENRQSCCEIWGYFMSLDEDAFDTFVGAELREVKLTDTALNTQQLHDHAAGSTNGFGEDYDKEYANTMFVTLETSAGPLQFTAYNEHNGYYGHEARVISRQLTHEETL